jgi:hypothetical protein
MWNSAAMKSTFLARKIRLNAPLLTLIAVCGIVRGCVAAPQSATVAIQPWPLYQSISRIFWDAEHQLQQRRDSFSSVLSLYNLPQTDPLYQKYFYVDNAAGRYLQLLDARGITESWTLPPVLYLGGIAAFTIGDYANAQKYFYRLLSDYPVYQRNTYINDRDAPDPDFAQPVKPAVTKLLFYCQIVASTTNHTSNGVAVSNAFTAFQ